MKLPKDMRVKYCLSSKFKGIVYSQLYSPNQIPKFLATPKIKPLNLYKIVTNSEGNISFYVPEISGKLWTQRQLRISKPLGSFDKFFWMSYEFQGRIGSSKNSCDELIKKLDYLEISPIDFLCITTANSGCIYLIKQSLDEVLKDLFSYSKLA